jgi:hypothetical protein
MTRILVVLVSALALSVPAALAVPPEDKPGKSAAAPGQTAEKQAQKAQKQAQKAEKKAQKQRCKALRKSDPAAFRAQCAKKEKAKDDDEDEPESESEDAREDNAAKKCKAERERIGVEEFKKKYAPQGHPNGANAFGKCVSKLSKEKETTG